MTAATAGTGQRGPRAVRVGLGLLAALQAAVAGCGVGNDGLGEVHSQNQANLAYPAPDGEAAQQALYDRLTAAANQGYGLPAGTGDQAGIHRDTWCLPAGTAAEPDLGGPTCTAAGPGSVQVRLSWLSAVPAGTEGQSERTASVLVEHRTDRYQFSFDTELEGAFTLTAPGLGSFDIVTARYTLDVAGTNLPPVYSQPTAASARADLLAYLASPEDLAAHATEKLETLRTQAQQWLDLPALRRQFDCETKAGIEGDVTRCRQAELSDSERDELRATVDATIDARIAEAQATAAALHPLLLEATLADRCPACWG